MKEDFKKVYILPNLLTAFNLACGFLAVLQIIEGTMLRQFEEAGWAAHYQQSLYYILAAFIFDMLDGRVARLGSQETPFGREFDSLADVVSFGVAPALLVFHIVLVEFHDWAWIVATVYLVFGALRLARFNMDSLDPNGKPATNDFTGFPIPAAAGLIASITLMLLTFYKDDPSRSIGMWKYALVGLMIFLSFMMFSTVKYPSFKALNWRTRRSVPRLIQLVLFVFLVAFFYRYSLAVVFTGYLIYGFVRHRLPKRWRPDFDDQEDEEEEISASK